MLKKLIAGILLVIAAACAFGAYSVWEEAYGGEQVVDVVKAGFEIPPLVSVLDLRNPQITISTDSYKNRRVLITWWKIECAPCVDDLTNLNKSDLTYDVIAVNVENNRFDALKFIDDHGFTNQRLRFGKDPGIWTTKILRDTPLTAAYSFQKFRLVGLPASLKLERTGKYKIVYGPIDPQW